MNLHKGQYEGIGASERGESVLLDVCDFFLLLVVRFHLIHFVLRLGSDKCGIIATVINQLNKEVLLLRRA